MKKTIALIGNPNSGKTLLFNKLTGSNQVVGNWPGVTVEHKSGHYRHDPNIEIIDLPGIYSLSSMSLEEEVTRDYLINNQPDLIINIIDSTSLERSLYLTTQVMEMNIPMVIALNMIDLLKKRGDVISCEHLHEHFKLPFIEISAAKNIGLDELVKYFYQEQNEPITHLPIFTNDVEQAVTNIEQLLKKDEIGTIPAHYLALKLLEQDKWAIHTVTSHTKEVNNIRDSLKKQHQEDVENLIVRQRYDYISNMITHCFEKRGKAQLISDKIDHIVTNRWLAFPIFFLVMWLMYYVSIQTIGQFCIDYIGEVVDQICFWLSDIMVSMSVSDWLISLVTNGILKGVGSIIGFVPQIMILYLFLSVLEDSGYMSRIAFIMDRLFMKLGLSGKSFIPMIVGTGCSVPGIMASRTIENKRDRNLTIIMTPFVPCGAKMPVFALIAGALFPGNPWIAPSLYFVAILVIIFSALLLKRILFKSEVSPFVLELPTYKWPQMDNVLHQVWEKGKGFILKAGTIILFGSMLIWFLGSFNTSLAFVSQQDSMLAGLGHFITPAFSLMGIDDWQFSVSMLTGFAAKEQIVATLGILLGTSSNLTTVLPQYLTPLSAYSFLLFVLLASPCFSAIATMHKELGSTKWTLFALTYQTGLAYMIAVLFYQIGLLLL